ncbi:MAG: DUF4331 domain-containing protein [Acidobacteriota bacterium]
MISRSSLSLLVSAAILLTAVGTERAEAANHREAPLTALDHKADIADFFAFVSYDDPSKVTFILDVDPLLEPSNGPNQFPFDPEMLYTIKIDNDFDASRDVAFEFRFKTEIRLPGVFQGLVGAGDGIPAPENSPAPVPPGTPIVPPAITALDGPGSEGFSLRQSYSVSLLRGGAVGATRTQLSEGRTLYAVPSNAGPRTMPDYPALADQGIYDLGDGIRVFAGTVEDPFWIDLGGAFDTLNLRADAFETGVPGVLSDAQDANDVDNFAADDVAGFNVNAIAIEVPITLLTADGEIHAADDPLATIGAWGTTSRRLIKVLRNDPTKDPILLGNFVQIQRMANPLFNELIIGTGSKDLFSRSLPRDDGQFADFALDPVLARVLNAAYDATVAPGVLPVPEPPRLDLLPLVQYVPPIAAEGTPAGPVADLLRLNTGVPPTPAADRSRLGLVGGDPAGWPNGRRVSDDVTDIALRAVVGVLAGGEFGGFPHNRVGDGVNANDADYRETFPYVGYAHSGVESRHVDPGEIGCTGVCP